jgi:hypothetical protein
MRIGEWKYSSTHSMTSALDGGEWSASRPGRFTPRERLPCARWIGDWVRTRAVLDAVVKRKILSPIRESNRRTPIVQPLVQRYADWAITALMDGSIYSLFFLFYLTTPFSCTDYIITKRRVILNNELFVSLDYSSVYMKEKEEEEKSSVMITGLRAGNWYQNSRNQSPD